MKERLNNYIILEIGKKIRRLRQQKEMTLQELADRASVSKGLISRIENSRTVPSLPVLIQIISGLDEEVNSFFEDIHQPEEALPVTIRRAHELTEYSKEHAIGFLYWNIMEKNLGELVIQSTILELDPGSQRKPVTTDGHEFKYILEGEVEYQIGDESYHLQAGDSLYFDARLPHVPINRSDQKVRMLVVYFLAAGGK